VRQGANALTNTDSRGSYMAATKDQRHALGKAAAAVHDGAERRIEGARSEYNAAFHCNHCFSQCRSKTSDSDSDIQLRVVAKVLEQSKKTQKPMSDSDKLAKKEILAAARANRASIADARREAAAVKEGELADLRAQVEEEERKRFVKKVRRDLRAESKASKAPTPAPTPALPAPVARNSWSFA
jgi:hypothetical protein